MKYNWEKLPKPMNCFTKRNAVMINLNNGKIIQHYSANTKIVVVQKCVTPEKTYYRTYSAYHHHLNYAFEASVFGLPNEKAPLAPSSPKIPSKNTFKRKPESRTSKPARKINTKPKAVPPDNGAGERRGGWFKKLFGRKNG